MVREVRCSCSSLDLVLKVSRTVGYTDACETSVELGSEGTDVTAETCDAKETDSAFLFWKPSQEIKSKLLLFLTNSNLFTPFIAMTMSDLFICFPMLKQIELLGLLMDY